jgi:hypothetical protein
MQKRRIRGEGLESDCEYTDEEGYLSEGDLDLSEQERRIVRQIRMPFKK